MAERVHYNDDLFFISSQIKCLGHGLSLEIDADHFLDKVIEDIFFIDGALGKIYASLKSQGLLIHRHEYLKNLLRAERSFVVFLTAILGGDFPFTAHLETFFGKIKTSRSRHGQSIAEIENLLQGETTDSDDGENLISDQEYRILLTEPEEG
jgi:hypothetical protein